MSTQMFIDNNWGLKFHNYIIMEMISKITFIIVPVNTDSCQFDSFYE